jgi:hypothetical protein
LGQIDQEIRYYQQSLATAQETNNRQRECSHLIGLARAYRSLGQLEKANT